MIPRTVQFLAALLSVCCEMCCASESTVSGGLGPCPASAGQHIVGCVPYDLFLGTFLVANYEVLNNVVNSVLFSVVSR